VLLRWPAAANSLTRCACQEPEPGADCELLYDEVNLENWRSGIAASWTEEVVAGSTERLPQAAARGQLGSRTTDKPIGGISIKRTRRAAQPRRTTSADTGHYKPRSRCPKKNPRPRIDHADDYGRHSAAALLSANPVHKHSRPAGSPVTGHLPPALVSPSKTTITKSHTSERHTSHT